jgi:hypothetical protein
VGGIGKGERKGRGDGGRRGEERKGKERRYGMRDESLISPLNYVWEPLLPRRYTV